MWSSRQHMSRRYNNQCTRWMLERLEGLFVGINWKGEISGSLGDLGTFLPLVVGLTQAVGLDLGTTLLFTGVYNIVSGFLFQVPIPVQPMKTIAAVALAESGALNIPEIMAAGIFVSSCVLFLGATRLMGLVNILVPGCVVRGMQLGVGIQLGVKGFKYIWYANGSSGNMREMWSVNGLFVGMVSLVFILLTIYPNEQEDENDSRSQQIDPTDGMAQPTERSDTDAGRKINSNENIPEIEDGSVEEMRREINGRSQEPLMQSSVITGPIQKYIVAPLSALGEKATTACDGKASKSHLAPCHCLPSRRPWVPAALVVVIAGIIMVFASDPGVASTLSMGPSKPSVIVPTSDQWKTGILRAGLPQLPLTTLNSVISVSQLANQLFPGQSTRPSEIATSVGMMNLVGCWFGAMPTCHGAGGLAAQTRFGARAGTAPVLLGILKIILSLLFGSSLFTLFQKFPISLLGSMLLFSGIELASVAKGQRGHRGIAIMLLICAITIAVSNVAIGVLIGFIGTYLFVIYDYISPKVVSGVKKLYALISTKSSEGQMQVDSIQ